MSKKPLNYKITAGELPVGISLKSDGTLSGPIDPINGYYDAPEWITPEGSLGTFNEETTPDIPPLVVTSPSKYAIIRISLKRSLLHLNNRGLPWGLTLDPITGIISGKISDLLDPFAQYWTDEETPIWQTPSSRLASMGEEEEINAAVAAIGTDNKRIVRYFVQHGGLPWGIQLDDKTGKFYGKTFRGLFQDSQDDPDDDIDPIIPPRWITPRGLLGNRNESDSVNIRLEAMAEGVRGISQYRIVKGFLPWGIQMTKDGLLYGTTEKLFDPYEPQYIFPGIPTWNTITVNGVENPTGIINTLAGVPLDIQIEPVPFAGRTINKFFMMPESRMPPGLLYDYKTNRITGTPKLWSPKQTSFTFTIKAIDNIGAFSYQSITINILV